MAEEFSVKWGYALDAPGRMAVEKQLEYIAAQGIDGAKKYCSPCYAISYDENLAARRLRYKLKSN